MKKNIVLLFFVMVISALLVYCSKESNLLGQAGQQDTVLISPTILFKSSAGSSSPDSVAKIRLTVTYGSINNTETFDYSAHSGTIRSIPAKTAFILKIEGLDALNTVIFSGTRSFTGLTENMAVEVTANEVSPVSPSNLILEALSARQVKLSWNDRSKNEKGFVFERSINNDSNFVEFYNNSYPNLKEMADTTTLEPGTIYYYRLRAYNDAGYSPYLMAQSVKTPSVLNIDTSAPTLLVTLPESVSDSNLTVVGKAYDVSGLSRVMVNGDSAKLNSDSSFSAKVHLKLDTNTITITAYDNSERRNSAVVSKVVRYNPAIKDTIAPMIEFTSPKKGDTVKTLTPLLLGKVSDEGSSVKSFKVNSTIVTPSGIDWTYTATLAGEGVNKIYLEAIDGKDNVRYDTLTLVVNTAILDTVAPKINLGSYTTGFMFNASPTPFAVTVTDDNGSGVDSVLIGDSLAVMAGTVYSSTIILNPDSNIVRIRSVDKKGNRSKDSLLVILNRAPYFTTTLSELRDTAYVGKVFLDTVYALDPDVANPIKFNALTFQKKAGPSDMTVNPNMGMILWVPKEPTTAKCTVIVSDKYEYRDTISWTITAYQGIPNIITEPQSQSVTAGNSVTLTVVAAGNPAPFYFWQRNGTTLTADSTQSNLTLTAPRVADGGQYRVIVRNSEGSDTSATVTLNVLSNNMWSPTNGPFGTKQVKAFTVSGGYIFAGTGAGVYRSNDDGENWEFLKNGLPSLSVTTMAASGSLIYASFYSSVYMSGDFGANWVLKGTLPSNAYVNALAFSTNNKYGGTVHIAGTQHGIFLSMNGDPWFESSSGLLDSNILSLAVDGPLVYAGTNRGVYRYNINEGSLWTEIRNGLTDTVVSALTVFNGKVLAGTKNGVYTLMSDGVTWKKMAGPGGIISNFAISGSKVFAVNYYNINILDTLSPAPYDTTWKLYFKAGQYINTIASLNGSLFLGSNTNVYRKPELGGSLVIKEQGMKDGTLYGLVNIENVLYAGLYGGVSVSRDNGNSWVRSTRITQPVYSFIDIGSYILAGGSGYVYSHYKDDDSAWTIKGSGMGGSAVHTLLRYGTNLYAGLSYNGVWWSNNNGETWSSLNSGLTDTNITALVQGSGKLFIGTPTGVYVSTDAGMTWGATNSGLTEKNVKSLAIQGNTLYAGTFDGIYGSSDYGATWSKKGLTGSVVQSILIDGTIVYAWTTKGFYQSADGLTWNQVNQGMSSSVYPSGLYHPWTTSGGTLFTGTLNGVWKRLLD